MKKKQESEDVKALGVYIACYYSHVNADSEKLRK